MITPRDTISANDSVLDAFRQSGDYDYVRDLGTGDGNDVNYFDVLTQKAGEMFDVDMSWLVLPEWFWWILGGVALAAVGYLIWKYRAKLFSPQDNKPKVQEITEDDINEVDFDQLIDEAQRKGDYLALCRLHYLKTLKAASDASLVTWKLYKTPTQYAMEWRDDDFKVMTNHFLRFRYGHYDADAALAEEMRSLQERLLARIGSSDGQAQAGQQQEGGEPS